MGRRLVAAGVLRGRSVQMFCEPCELIGDPMPAGEGAVLAEVHDRLTHGPIGETAELLAVGTDVVADGQGIQLASVPGARMCWEIDAPDGTPLYRVADIDLADDLYHAAPAGSHLLPVMAVAGGR
jgi:hypothetical protein